MNGPLPEQASAGKTVIRGQNKKIVGVCTATLALERVRRKVVRATSRGRN